MIAQTNLLSLHQGGTNIPSFLCHLGTDISVSPGKKGKGRMQTHFQKEGDIPEEFLMQFMLTTLLKKHDLQGTRETEQYEVAMYLDSKSKLA